MRLLRGPEHGDAGIGDVGIDAAAVSRRLGEVEVVFALQCGAECPRQAVARVATADPDARPQVTPVGMWRHDPATDSIEVSGRNFETTRKFRNARANPNVAFVVDDAERTEPWAPRAVIVEGRAEAVGPTDGSGAVIRIHPDRVISWGVD